MKNQIRKSLINSIKNRREFILFYLIFTYYFFINIFQITLKKGKPIVLAVDRPRFNLDATQLKKNKNIRLIVVSRKIFYFIGKVFIKKDFQLQSSYHFRKKEDIALWNKTIGMIHSDVHEKILDFEAKILQLNLDKKNLYSYYEYLYKKYLEKFNISHLLLSNVDYWEVQEFSKVLKKNGTRINILYRESIASPKQTNYLKNYYSSDCFKNLSVDKIFVFGEKAKNIFKDTLFVNNENVHSVGAPRIDYYKNIKNLPIKNMVTLFDFSLPSYKLQNTAFETILILYKLSKKYPNIKFLVKTKTQKETNKIISKNLVKNSSNFQVSNNVKMKKIMENSKIIIGTNTTAVLETLFLKTHIMFPSWNVEDNNMENLIVNNKIDPSKFMIFDNPHEFEKKLEYFLNSKINISSDENKVREKIIEQNFSDFSFKSSEKLIDLLLV
tara:strand:- start:11792 stop:13111 length:1320 start_codon:yes stop_codon:yes gene_type:complete